MTGVQTCALPISRRPLAHSALKGAFQSSGMRHETLRQFIDIYVYTYVDIQFTQGEVENITGVKIKFRIRWSLQLAFTAHKYIYFSENESDTNMDRRRTRSCKKIGKHNLHYKTNRKQWAKNKTKKHRD